MYQVCHAQCARAAMSVRSLFANARLRLAHERFSIQRSQFSSRICASSTALFVRCKTRSGISKGYLDITLNVCTTKLHPDFSPCPITFRAYPLLFSSASSSLNLPKCVRLRLYVLCFTLFFATAVIDFWLLRSSASGQGLSLRCLNYSFFALLASLDPRLRIVWHTAHVSILEDSIFHTVAIISQERKAARLAPAAMSALRVRCFVCFRQ